MFCTENRRGTADHPFQVTDDELLKIVKVCGSVGIPSLDSFQVVHSAIFHSTLSSVSGIIINSSLSHGLLDKVTVHINLTTFSDEFIL